MAKQVDRIKEEIRKVYDEGLIVFSEAADLEKKRRTKSRDSSSQNIGQTIRHKYQNWYSKALPIVRGLLPERIDEFLELYQLKKRKDISGYTYGISDYLMGYQAHRVYSSTSLELVPAFDPFTVFFTKMEQQLAIFASAKERVESAVADIEGILQASLFDSELHAAEELLSKGHLRAAGTLAGVTLEAHLSKVCSNHGLKSRKKQPSISDFNELLKVAGTIDVPIWRNIQYMADIRNLSVHVKDRDPTSNEIFELISGVKTVISNVF